MTDAAMGRTLYLGIDSSKAQAGAAQFRAAIDGVADATRRADGTVSQYGAEFERLAGRLNPAVRAQREFVDAQRVLQRELQQGNISLRTYAEYLERAKRQAEQAAGASSKFGGVLSSLGQGLIAGVGIGGALGISELAGGFLRAADASQRLQNQLSLATGSVRESQQAFAALYDIAQRTGTPIEALATLYGRASIAAKELNASQADIVKFTAAVGNALRVAGQSPEQAQGALLQLSQSLGSGTVRAEEFNSVIEGALPLLVAAAKHIDGAAGSVAKLRQLVIDGKLSSEEYFRAIIAGGADLEKQASGMEQTMSQATTKIGNALVRLVGDMDKATGATSTLKGGMNTLAEAFDTVATAIEGSQGRIDAQIDQQRKKVEYWQSLAKQQSAAAAFIERNAGVTLPDSVLGFGGGASRRAAEQERQRLDALTTVKKQSAFLQLNDEVEKDRLKVPVGTQTAEEKVNLDVQRLRITALREEAQATTDLTEKRKKLIEAATIKRDVDIAEIRKDSKKFATGDDRTAAEQAVARVFAAEQQRITLETAKTQAKAEAKAARPSPAASKLREQADLLVSEAEDQGISVKIVSLIRTREEQQRLYDEYIARGKTGLPVAPPGKSQHETGRAFDVAIEGGGTPEQWRRLGAIGKAQGLRWGGDLAQQDRVHFEVPTALERATAAREKRANDFTGFVGPAPGSFRAAQEAGLEEGIKTADRLSKGYETLNRLRLESLHLQGREVEAIELQRQTALDAIGQQVTGEEQYQEAVRLTNEIFDDRVAAASDSLTEQATGTQSATEAMSSSFQSFGQVATSAFEDAVISGGKLSDVLTGLAEDMQRLLLRASLNKALSLGIDGLASLFGPSLEGGATASLYTTSTYGAQLHDGGVVGQDAAPMRAVPHSLIRSAPRFHTGLMPNEFPAVLQRGEGVFTKAQMAALAPASAGQSSPKVTVNVTNNAAAAVSVSQQESADGGLDVNMIIEAVTNHIAAEQARPGTAMNRSLSRASRPLRAT